MSVAGASASPKTAAVVHPDGKRGSIKYGPLTYKARGELERLYAEVAVNPLDAFDRAVEDASPEDIEREGGPEGIARQRRQVEQAARYWSPNPEEEAARLLLLENVGRPEGSDRDYRAAFLAVALGQFSPGMTEEQAAHYADQLTKGQLRDVYNLALETGPYAPK